MTKIIVEILLDPDQTTPEKRESIRHSVAFAAEGALEQCFPTSGRRGKNVPDYEVTSRVEEEDFS